MTDYKPPTIEDVPIILDVFERVRAGEPAKMLDALSRHYGDLRRASLKRLGTQHPRRVKRLKPRRWEGKLGIVCDRMRGAPPAIELSYTCVWCGHEIASLGLGQGVKITTVFYEKLDRHTAECALTYLVAPHELGLKS